jgi:hypothetical protein
MKMVSFVPKLVISCSIFATPRAGARHKIELLNAFNRAVSFDGWKSRLIKLSPISSASVSSKGSVFSCAEHSGQF